MSESDAIKGTFKQIEGFWQDSESDDPSSTSWDWSVDKNQVAMLEKAKERGANLLELFSNSPMWWMCKNHNPSGDENENNLDDKYHHTFAKYLATVAEYFKQ